MREFQKLSIIIPVYNEEQTVEEIFRRSIEVDISLAKEFLFVDDASTDSTRTILERLAREHENIHVLSHTHNQGKGAAIRTTLREIIGAFLSS